MLGVRGGPVPRSGHGHRSLLLAGVGLAVAVGAGMSGSAASSAAASPGASFGAGGVSGAGVSRLAGLSWPGRLMESGPIPGSVLGGVWCQAGGGCMAAGYTQTRSTAYTLAERWNGAGWTVMPSPNPVGGTYSGFMDLTCLTSNECFAAMSGRTGVRSACMKSAGRIFTRSWMVSLRKA